MPLGLSLPRDTVSDPSTHPETQVLDNNDKTKKDYEVRPQTSPLTYCQVTLARLHLPQAEVERILL